MSDFDKAINIVLEYEGGYVLDPRDPGGETKFGVCKRSYPGYDIKNLTIDQAKAIYEKDFWKRSNADRLPWPLSLFHVDCAVNCGNAAATKILQRALVIDDDGVWGKQTETALQVSLSNLEDLCERYLKKRYTYYESLKGWTTYQHNWSMRLITLALKAGF
jgi:lysozyme family protein